MALSQTIADNALYKKLEATGINQAGLAREQIARSILSAYLKSLPLDLRTIGDTKPTLKVPETGNLPSLPKRSPDAEIRIGIIGAGAAGLCTALALEKLISLGIKISYDILEAQPKASEPPGPEDHPHGGRLWTYKFPAKDGKLPGANDYYDRGAMRFPDIPLQRPVFKLFEDLQIRLDNKRLIPYYLSLDQNLKLFNGRLRTNKELKYPARSGTADPFETGVQGLTASSSEMLIAQLKPFRKLLRENAEPGSSRWKEAMEADDWSTRGYMRLKGTDGKTYSTAVVDYLETLESGTGMYDVALIETVLESLQFDFEANPESDEAIVKWYCVQGGVGEIANAIVGKLKHGHIINGARVTAIEPCDSAQQPTKHILPRESLRVFHTDPADGKGNVAYQEYDHVITTVPFGCLRMINTSKLKFNWGLNSAIRSLRYGHSTKIGIRFKTRWWETRCDQKGGVSSTDRPSRMIIYPSYGINGSDGASMIVSYSWEQDAVRLGALCRGKGSVEEKVLIGMVLDDLAAVHAGYDISRTFLEEQMLDYDAWCWDHQPTSCGAFAYFGPTQFSGLYTEVTRPFNGSLHFAGEATSAHHAWLLGAVNSACRVMNEILYAEGADDDVIKQANEMWEGVGEFDHNVLKKQVWLGRSTAAREFDQVKIN